LLRPAEWSGALTGFKCLIPPARRQLVTLLFPIGDFAGGPPYAINPAAVEALLKAAGFERLSLEPLPPQQSHPARAVRLRRRERGGWWYARPSAR
jgi:hypothetical protein